VDSGTQLLLKVFSGILDEDKAAERPLPHRVLDSGCGAGIIGICAAAALSALQKENSRLHVRCQDRDELARLFTLHNATKNNIPPTVLEAHTEPLLAGPTDPRWDLIFTNIPAKAGTPVLEDFVRRSAALLNPGGRVIMVAVNTLADFFRRTIISGEYAPAKAGVELILEHKGPGHTVFVYGNTDCNTLTLISPVNVSPGFLTQYPFYIRATALSEIEKIPVKIATINGAPGYDKPGGMVTVAAKLMTNLASTKQLQTGRIEPQLPLLVHEPGQGFFPCWLIEFLKSEYRYTFLPDMNGVNLVLSGRNILALEAARHNIFQYNQTTAVVVPAADLQLGRSAILEASSGRQYAFIAAFPELLPQSSLPKGAKGQHDQLTALWDALSPLLCEGGIFLAAFGSSEAERFDRKKPQGFTRLGSIKRNGFRALVFAYRSGCKSRFSGVHLPSC
jgi:hypothetical protein